MRGLISVVLSLVAALPAGAQPSTPGPSATPVAAGQSPPSAPSADRRARLAREIEVLRRNGEDGLIPAVDSFTFGTRTIPAETVADGPVGVADGDLHVAGRVDGNVYVIDGDVILEPGGVVTGDVLDVGGHVRYAGGRVDGEIRTLSGVDTKARGAARHAMSTWDAVRLTFGAFAILFIIGVGVLMFAEGNLDGVTAALEQSFTRSFWLGVLGQLLLLPVLMLLLVGLVLTVLGILLVPFAIVTYFIAAAGLVTLGFLAATRVLGSAWSRRVASPRALSLRGLLLGLIAFALLWLAAAALTRQPVAGPVLRLLATVVTWVAATAGLGATLSTRAGTQRPGARPGARASGSGSADLSWQTPTPVSGVAAARRPQSVSPRSDG